MKHALKFLILLVCVSLEAQVTTPQASTSAKLEQVVGLTSIEITYARPAARGRTIFGDLVPYGQKWRTAANANTTVMFSDDVVIDGNNVKAGTYALYSTPNKGSWTMYLYNKTDNWGLPKEWEDELVVATFEAKSSTTSTFVENFTIQVSDIQSNKAHLQISWEKTMVEFAVEVPTEEKVMQSIEATLASDPKARDYYNAAVYYFEEGKDIKQVIEWIDKAMDMQEQKPFWMLRQQALMYHKAGKKKEAVQLAEASLEAAVKAGNDDYIKMNKESLRAWKEK